jgi:hypothetical protein
MTTQLLGLSDVFQPTTSCLQIDFVVNLVVEEHGKEPTHTFLRNSRVLFLLPFLVSSCLNTYD